MFEPGAEAEQSKMGECKSERVPLRLCDDGVWGQKQSNGIFDRPSI